MKICFSVSFPKIDSPIDPRFGRAPYFLLTDEKGKDIQVINNPGIQAMGGAGITAAQAVVSAGAQMVITGNLGPNAFNVLKASGVKIITGVFDLSAQEALEKYNQGELKETTQPNVPGHFGMGRRFGGRGGFGPGRGGFDPGGDRQRGSF